MEKFVPYEKLSKKKQRELNAMKRGSWGGLNPVTRNPANPKAYNRKAAQRWKDDSNFEPFCYVSNSLFFSEMLLRIINPHIPRVFLHISHILQ